MYRYWEGKTSDVHLAPEHVCKEQNICQKLIGSSFKHILGFQIHVEGSDLMIKCEPGTCMKLI